jgi:tetratricopeptide (TPR) repeat protein
MSARSVWRSTALVAAFAGGAVAQPPPPPGRPSTLPSTPTPGLPVIEAPTEPARAVVSADAIPELPPEAPDRFAVMAFENHTSFDSLDYLIAGVPFALAEMYEAAFALEPAYGPLIVPAPVVPGMPKTVAPFAAQVGAPWVFTGWVERPNWELRVVVELWQIDGGVATKVGQAERTGPFPQLHRFLGEIGAELAPIAGWKVADPTALSYEPGGDHYAYTMFGKGLGYLVGVLGPTAPQPNPKLALADLERATFINPKLVEAQRVLGALLATLPEPRAAARAAGKYSYAIDLRPEYTPALRAAADVARAAGKDEVALGLYRRLLNRRPWDLDARFRLGEAMWKTGDSGRAVTQLQQVASRRPDDLATRRVLALIHAERGDTTHLVRELEAIADRAPGDLEVKLDLAGAYAAQEQWQPALAAYEEVARARPLDVALVKRIGDVRRWQGDIAGSDDWYRRARKLAPDDPRAYFAAAASYLARGMVPDAEKVLLAAQRFRDHLGPTYHALGVLALRAQRDGEAALYLRKAIRLQPRRIESRVGVIAAELMRHDRVLAARQLQAARKGWPDDPDLVYLEGVLQAQAGNRGAARRELARALELRPDHPQARVALAAIDAGGQVSDTAVPAIPIELPYGDARELTAAIERFEKLDVELGAVRQKIQGLQLQLLGSLGEGPAKVRVRGAQARARRVCPLVDVVRPWQEAQKAMAAFNAKGVELEHAHRYLARHAALGEAANLLPDARARLNAARKAFALDVSDIRELRAGWVTSVGRELKAHGCSDRLLAAAAEDPGRYRPRIAPREVTPTQTRKPREPRRESFFVDNRDCTEELNVYIDGERVGTVPGGERSALTADTGQRTLCLINKGTASCGDRGTVRQVYLHEGWEVAMKCPK